MMTQSMSPWRRPGARRIIAVAGVSAVVLAAAIGPSSATGSSSTSVTIAASVNGVTGAPAFTNETGTVGITLTNQTLKTLAGYGIVVPKGIGTVTTLGVNNANWSSKLVSCGLISNCSALYIVTAKTTAARLAKGASITSSFSITPPSPTTATFRVIGVGDDSGLVIVGSQPTVTIVNGAATKLVVTPLVAPVIKGEPKTVTVQSFREYPAGTFTPKPFPGPLTLTAAFGDITYTAPDVTGQSSVDIPVTFGSVQVDPLQKLTATSGGLSADTSFEVVAAGVVSTDAVIKLTGAGGTTYTAKLPNGSTGPVSFTEVPCTALPGDPTCDTEVNLNGNFKAPGGTPLYSNEAPAQIDWTCPAAECPSTPHTYGSFDQDQVNDFQNYRIQVSLLVNGSYTPFVDAEECNPIVTNPADVVTGRITKQSAKDAGFCIDVYAISRADNSFGGDLTVPVLFVEDPKLRGI